MSYKDFSQLREEFKTEIDYCRNLKIGDKIKFKSEKGKYTVKAKSDRFLICTKPYNPKRTVIYTIIDLERIVRGTDNLIFGIYDYAVQEDIEECLKKLELEKNSFNGIEVSHRNCIKLDVEIIA